MADKDTNDDQAKKLIEALAPKIAEAIMPQITEAVEGQIKGIKDKNDELLGKLAEAKQSDAFAGLNKLLEAADSQQKARLNKDGVFQADVAGQPVRITKSDARNVTAYRKAKALAAERGVALEVIADSA